MPIWPGVLGQRGGTEIVQDKKSYVADLAQPALVRIVKVSRLREPDLMVDHDFP